MYVRLLQLSSIYAMIVLVRAGEWAWKKQRPDGTLVRTPPSVDPSLFCMLKIDSSDLVSLWNVDGYVCIAARYQVQRAITSSELKCQVRDDAAM
jgi:hypothetical protein